LNQLAADHPTWATGADNQIWANSVSDAVTFATNNCLTIKISEQMFHSSFLRQRHYEHIIYTEQIYIPKLFGKYADSNGCLNSDSLQSALSNLLSHHGQFAQSANWGTVTQQLQAMAATGCLTQAQAVAAVDSLVGPGVGTSVFKLGKRASARASPAALLALSPDATEKEHLTAVFHRALGSLSSGGGSPAPCNCFTCWDSECTAGAVEGVVEGGTECLGF